MPHVVPDWRNLAISVASFLVFWFIFGRLFFKPFLRLIGDRERRLKEMSERTERLINEQKAALARHATEVAEVRRLALAQREKERREAQEKSTAMIEQARDEARTQLEQVRAGIEAEFAAAADQLEQMAQTLAAELAGRVLERPLDGRHQARLNS